MSQQNKQLIQQYPVPIVPFQNPTCRETYRSLPRIYGRQEKKKYFPLHPHQHHNPTHPRLPKQSSPQPQIAKSLHKSRLQLQSHDKLQRITSDLRHQQSFNHQKNTHGLDKNASVEQKRLKSLQFKKSSVEKHKKIILPNLKVFDSQDLNEMESAHKVYKHVVSIQMIKNPSERYQNLSEEKVIVEGQYSEGQKREKVQKYEDVELMDECQEERIRSDTQEEKTKITKKKEHPLKEKKAKYEQKEKMKTQNDQKRTSTPQNKWNYVYLENRTKTKENSLSRNTKRQLDLEADQICNMISASPPLSQRQERTMYHYNKEREDNSPYLKKHINKKKATIALANQFGFNKNQDISSVLINYKPLSPDFNLKDLVKQPNFSVIPTEDRLYFGQMKEGKSKNGVGVTLGLNYIFQGVYEQNEKVEGAQKGVNGLYIGHLKSGKRHGQGKFTWNNGQSFEGEWQNGHKNGFGIWKSHKGDYYQGEWHQNKQNGKGYFIHKNNSTYRGYFRQFLKHGKGEEEFVNGDKYVGEFQNGKPHGYGRYVWENGDSFEGEFVEGWRQGKGVFRKVIGNVFEGYYQNDMRNGDGRERFKSGEYFQGEYRNNEPYKGKYYSKTGKQLRSFPATTTPA